MGIIFANPLWLLGALVLVPVAAHLFSRTRPRKRPFPSIVLLREAVRRVTRLRRPQDRWLLLLRVLAIAALIFAFLQPWLLSRFSVMGDAPRTLVLVVDSSASMGYVDGTRARIAQATGAAEELLRSLPGNSRANVVWIRGQASAAMPEPGGNFDFLRDELRRAVAYPEAGNIDAALALAFQQLAASPGEKELCVISDFQKSAWQDRNWSMPQNVKLTRVAIGDGTESNVALAELTTEPASPMAGKTAKVVARVRNLSGESRRTTVYAEAGSSRLSQTLELAPWSEGLAMMPVVFAAEGENLLKASLGEDRYPGDDSRHLLAHTRGPLQVGVLGAENNATGNTWLRGLQSLDGVAARRVTRGSIATSRVKVLFVAGWDGGGSEELQKFVAAGGALIVQPAATLPANGLVKLLPGSAVKEDGEPLRKEERPEVGWSIRIAAENHPLFSLFSSGAYGDPVAGKFRQRVSPPAMGKEFRPLLAFEDGAPALALGEVRISPAQVAPIALWNLDLAASDWPTRAAFLPFFGEFLQQMAGYTESRTLAEFAPGEALRFEPDPSVDPKEVELVDQNDKKVELIRNANGRSGLLATASGVAPGAYRWMAQGAVLQTMVVNFPSAESDLRRMEKAALEQSGGEVIAQGGSQNVSRLRDGIALWPWCLAFAALCLLLEGWLLRRIARSAPTETVVKTEKKKEEEAALV